MVTVFAHIGRENQVDVAFEPECESYVTLEIKGSGLILFWHHRKKLQETIDKLTAMDREWGENTALKR